MLRGILIADDDARMRQIIRQVIDGLASEVYEAADGAEAIELCFARRPDWVLMDLRMSPVDGFRALLEIKAGLPETHVIIVSQYDDAGLRVKALRAGANSYVLKENLCELPAILVGMTAKVRDQAASRFQQKPPAV
jgi:CheY-like chemotaxis protein